MRRFLFVAALLSMSCLPATMGRPIDAEQVKSFRVGQTTRAEVEAALGPPAYEIMDGRDTALTWTYSERDEGYVYRSKVLSLRFGPDGVMKDLYDVPGGRPAPASPAPSP